MIGVDTNLLVRLYTSDDPKQTPLAVQALRNAAPVFVPKSVVLELYWVLHSVYETPRLRLIKVLRHLLNLDLLRIEDEETVETALLYFEQGLEFPDALHLASCSRCDRLLTFDKTLAKRANQLKLTTHCEVPGRL